MGLFGFHDRIRERRGKRTGIVQKLLAVRRMRIAGAFLIFRCLLVLAEFLLDSVVDFLNLCWNGTRFLF